MLNNSSVEIPRVLVIDDQHMPQQLFNQLYLQVKYAQLTSVTDTKRACEAMTMVGCDYIIINESSQLDQINGYLEANPQGTCLRGVIWITNTEELDFNPAVLSKISVYLVDAASDNMIDNIELLAQGWDGVLH